jgi:NosR/NirI family nitrous oxide reductase transcriptional regulator
MAQSRFAAWIVRLYRIVALLLAAMLLHLAAQRGRALSGSEAVSLAQAQLVFPAAQQLGEYDGARQAFAVLGESGAPLGYVLTTSPQTDDLIGYSGPSNLLIGLTPAGDIAAVRLLTSGDTPAHVAEVQASDSFWQSFPGWSAQKNKPPPAEAVSGSTLTSLAMAEAVQQRLSGEHRSLRFGEPLTLQELREVYPQAATLVPDRPRAGWIEVCNPQGEPLGYAVRTSPQADNVIGYAGPTEVWVAVALDQRTVQRVRLRKSYDTEEYVDRLRDDETYLASLGGRSIDDWATLDFAAEGIEGVSGATQTSYAVAEGLRRFAADAAAQAEGPAGWRPQPRDGGLLLVIAGAVLLAFSRWRGHRRLRLVWQAVLILGFGLWLGDLLSIALLVGWARHGVPWHTAPVLVLLAAMALLMPWGTRRQVYCHYVCPHGAAQEWLGQFRRLHGSLPKRVSRALSILPFLLLAWALLLGLGYLSFDLSQLEPFDAWVLKLGATVPAIIAVVGLAASVVVPQAYCRFGCPTGALFKLIAASGHDQRFRRGDGLVLVALLAASAYVGLPRLIGDNSSQARRAAPIPPAFQASPADASLAGHAFGTTWRIKLRGEPADRAALRGQIDSELERIESTLSHWRETSATSQFNASGTTVAMELPAELIELVDFAQRLSAASDGAFDLTLAPLADAWGYGPSGPRSAPPTDEELAALLQRIGWQRLQVDMEARTLRKRSPELQLDLGALLQGYAADRIANVLTAGDVPEFLIEVGGELRARGAWQVAIENPAGGERPLCKLWLRDAALATSGVYRSSAQDLPGHILDAHTGRPVRAAWQLCAVIQPTCLAADGWATTLLASAERGPALAERENLAALFCDVQGNVTLTPAAAPLFREP